MSIASFIGAIMFVFCMNSGYRILFPNKGEHPASSRVFKHYATDSLMLKGIVYYNEQIPEEQSSKTQQMLETDIFPCIMRLYGYYNLPKRDDTLLQSIMEDAKRQLSRRDYRTFEAVARSMSMAASNGTSETEFVTGSLRNSHASEDLN